MGIILSVKVIPGARRQTITRNTAGMIVIHLTAPPERGAANDALCRLLSTRLGISIRAIELLSGARSRIKRLAITGLTHDEVTSRLGIEMQHALV